jgi:hypothetical protein
MNCAYWDPGGCQINDTSAVACDSSNAVRGHDKATEGHKKHGCCARTMYGTMGVCCGIMRIGSRIIVFPRLGRSNESLLEDEGVHSVSLTTDFCDSDCATFGSYRDGPTLNTYPCVHPRHTNSKSAIDATRRDGVERIVLMVIYEGGRRRP